MTILAILIVTIKQLRRRFLWGSVISTAPEHAAAGEAPTLQAQRARATSPVAHSLPRQLNSRQAAIKVAGVSPGSPLSQQDEIE